MRKKRDPGFYALFRAAEKLTAKTKHEDRYEVMRTSLFNTSGYALVLNDRIHTRGDAVEILKVINIISEALS